MIVSQDSTDEGFNDPTPTAALPSNPGTTLGEQRLNVAEAAANYVGSYLDSSVPIIVHAQFDPIVDRCRPNAGVLAGAGPNGGSALRFDTNPPLTIAFTAAQTNSLLNFDTSPDVHDINMTINSAVGTADCLTIGWDYSIGAARTVNGIDLFNTVIHELMHGLGFLTLADKATGAFVEANNAPVTDVFSANLGDTNINKIWSDMTPEERSQSAVGEALVWTGARTRADASFLTNGVVPVAGGAGPLVKMYAPNELDSGSSVSHFDESLEQNELMEPSADSINEVELTFSAMYDMLWPGTDCLSLDVKANVWSMFSIDCVPAGTNSVADLFGDDDLGVLGEDWFLWKYDAATGAYKPVLENDPLELGRSYWIIHPADKTIDIPNASTRTPLTIEASEARCHSVLGCREQSLTAIPGRITSWQMLGNPFNTAVRFGDVRITTSSGPCAGDMGCSPQEAEDLSIFGSTVFTWTGESYVQVTAGATLPQNAGFWAQTMGNAPGMELVLTLPKDRYLGRF